MLDILKTHVLSTISGYQFESEHFMRVSHEHGDKSFKSQQFIVQSKHISVFEIMYK